MTDTELYIPMPKFTGLPNAVSAPLIANLEPPEPLDTMDRSTKVPLIETNCTLNSFPR